MIKTKPTDTATEKAARGRRRRGTWRKELTAEETTLRKLVLRVAATARASSVLPIHQLLAYLSLPDSHFQSSLSSSLMVEMKDSLEEGRKEGTYQFLGDRIVIHPWVV